MSKILCETKTGAKVTETFDPISRSVVFDWTDTYPDFPPYQHQLIWSEGSSHFIFGTKSEGREWANIVVRNDNFRPSTRAEARTMAQAFIVGGEA